MTTKSITAEDFRALREKLDKASLFGSVERPMTAEEGPHGVIFLRDADGHIFASMPREVYDEVLKWKGEVL